MNAVTEFLKEGAQTVSILGGSMRVESLKKAVQDEEYHACIERAMLWTKYCKKRSNRGKSRPELIAEALRYVLNNKTVEIYPQELVVGNFTSRRVGGIFYPEKGGLAAMYEVFKLPKRRVNPLKIGLMDQLKLYFSIPYWLNKNISYMAFDTIAESKRYAVEQYWSLEYQIYENGGIAHFAPGYEKIIRLGAEGIIQEVEQHEAQTSDVEKLAFYRGVKIAMQALAEFGERYSQEASRAAKKEKDPVRKQELERIAQVCARVPRHGATNLYEAVQCLALTHIAIFQETQGETTCPGRLDQFLNPYYEQDLAKGLITREEAKELLGSFCVKICETIPIWPDTVGAMLGGMTSWEVITIGGQDRQGNDATNELSFIMLELADELRMRQPNFHVRLHDNTPKDFYDEVIRVNFGSGSAPAMYNDELIIESMTENGYSLEDARDYVAIGCVEPTAPGKTIGSTDAAMYNMPLALELALNEGCMFGSTHQYGAKTRPISAMTKMQDVVDAYDVQTKHQLGKLCSDLQAIERIQGEQFPVPLTSATVEGCLEQGLCSTKGGATYNFPGIQGSGISTVADSLYAIEQAVFTDGWLSLEALVKHLEDNISDEVVYTKLRGIDKFGNDVPAADAWMKWVGDHYSDCIRALGKNTRGGQYQAGIYSNTSHTHFGSLVSAMPNGRRKGEAFASGFAPENGMDKRGTTALINSMNRMDFKKFANGINFNIKLDASSYDCEDGREALASMYKVYFKRHGMQVQANMLDPKVLIEARDDPDSHPNLLIRVSGYSAYFNDLSPEMQDEVISRSSNAA